MIYHLPPPNPYLYTFNVILIGRCRFVFLFTFEHNTDVSYFLRMQKNNNFLEDATLIKIIIPYFILLLIVVSYDILKHFQKDKLAIHKN